MGKDVVSRRKGGKVGTGSLAAPGRDAGSPEHLENGRESYWREETVKSVWFLFYR